MSRISYDFYNCNPFENNCEIYRTCFIEVVPATFFQMYKINTYTTVP